MKIRVQINNFRISGIDMIGDLAYIPYYIFIREYKFQKGDEVYMEEDGSYHIYMDEHKLFNIQNFNN